MTRHEPETARTAIWTKELAIYQARSRGDLATYLSEITPTYLAWPPLKASPINAGAFAQQVAAFNKTDAEQLGMALTDFSLDGDTAVLYYATHRTALPDGRPVDERFDVVHVWLWRDDAWKLFAGMARPRVSAMF